MHGNKQYQHVAMSHEHETALAIAGAQSGREQA